MQIKGEETKDIMVEIPSSRMLDAIRRKWLEGIINSADAIIVDGQWYSSFYSAYPDHGEGYPIRNVTKDEQTIYDGFELVQKYLIQIEDEE